MVKRQHQVHRNVAVCVTPLRSVAAPHLGASKIETQMRVASEVTWKEYHLSLAWGYLVWRIDAPIPTSKASITENSKKQSSTTID